LKIAKSTKDPEKQTHLDEALKFYEKAVGTKDSHAKAVNYNGIGLIYMERK
jgi:hypothetical protein